jgi:hypothetical protein
MTAEARGVTGHGAPFLAQPEKAPKAIRAALLPEDIAEFDAEFRVVMAKATQTMVLAGVSAFIERWWRVAWSAAHPAEHRVMLQHADQLLAGEAVHTTPWAETRSSLGL